MKINISESELRPIVEKVVAKVIMESIDEKKISKDGYLKASRSASRDLEKEFKGDGFKQTDKVHKSPKDYSRKGRGKDDWKKEIDEEVGSVALKPYKVNEKLWGLDINGTTIYARKIADFNTLFDKEIDDAVEEISGKKKTM